MKAAERSEWATYGALVVAAALVCLLALSRPLPVGLRTTLHLRLEEPIESDAGIEVAVAASGSQPGVDAATLSAGQEPPAVQASSAAATLVQLGQDVQAAGQAARGQPSEAEEEEKLADDEAVPAQPAEKLGPEGGDRPPVKQPAEGADPPLVKQTAEQQKQQQADSSQPQEQQQVQQQGAQPTDSQLAAAKPELQQAEQAPSQQEQQAQQPATTLPPPPAAKRGIDIYREFQANLSSCFTEWAGLECLRQQQDWTPGPGQYRFPHFGIIGFQKCATTSLFHHLAGHPQVLHSFPKEPEFFTDTCNFNALRCPHPAQFKYMKEVLRFSEAQALNFTVASFEGSTHYALQGTWLAPQMRHYFPWLRLIVSMREPISQAISMVFHNLDSGRNVPCYNDRGGGRVYRCGLEYLEDESRYATWLRPWLDAFPPEQLYVFQYENLTLADNMQSSLRDLKRWLGIARALPNDELPVSNARHQTKQTDGWPMKRWEYWKLVEKARRNMMEVIEIVEKYGYADIEGWQKNWEDWWQMNLDERCGPQPESECMILLS